MIVAENAAALIARALARQQPADRPAFLRELIAHAAAGITVLEGHEAACEAVYRLADAMVADGND